jgi:dihydroorotase-like cyclic amidohydrolase
MPSEKVTRILKKRGLSEDQIAALNEQAAWDHVYATAPVKREKGPDICFTGFSDIEKAVLVAKAKAAGLNVVTKVTVNLFMLCVGDSPGESKVKQATVQKARIINPVQLEAFCSSGEIPTNS